MYCSPEQIAARLTELAGIIVSTAVTRDEVAEGFLLIAQAIAQPPAQPTAAPQEDDTTGAA